MDVAAVVDQQDLQVIIGLLADALDAGGQVGGGVHGFLETDKVLTQREFATHLMEEPCSFY